MTGSSLAFKGRLFKSTVVRTLVFAVVVYFPGSDNGSEHGSLFSLADFGQCFCIQ